MGIRGLFVGINSYSERPLKGCVNDVTAVRELFRTQHAAADDQLRLVTDAAATRQAIIDNLGCSPNHLTMVNPKFEFSLCWPWGATP